MILSQGHDWDKNNILSIHLIDSLVIHTMLPKVSQKIIDGVVKNLTRKSILVGCLRDAWDIYGMGGKLDKCWP